MASAMLPSVLRMKFPELRGGWAPPGGWPDRISLEEGEEAEELAAAVHEFQDASTGAEEDDDDKTMDGQEHDSDDSDCSAHINTNNHSDDDALPQPPGAMYVNRSETVQYLLFEKHLKLLEKWHLPGDGVHDQDYHTNSDAPTSPSTQTTTNTHTATATATPLPAQPSHGKRKPVSSPERTTPSRTRQRVRAQPPKTAQQHPPNTSPSTQGRSCTPLKNLSVDIPNNIHNTCNNNDSSNHASPSTPPLPKVKRRGACIRVTTPSAAADRRRRNRMNERFERLRMLVPGNQGLSSTQISKAGVLDAAIEYVKKLKSLSEASTSDDVVNVRNGKEDGVMIARIRYASRRPLLHDILRAISELKLQVLDGRYTVEGDKLKGDFLVKKTAVSESVDSAKLKDTLENAINNTNHTHNTNHNNIKHEPSSPKKYCAYGDSLSISANKYTTVQSDDFLAMPPCA